MSWRRALVRIASYDVDELRKRLSAILDRRQAMEMKLVMLAAEVEAEMRHADSDAELRVYRAGFLQGVKVRREKIDADLAELGLEEAGARDALTLAFEAQKKFEHVEEMDRLAGVKLAARRDTAEMDALGLRAKRV